MTQDFTVVGLLTGDPAQLNGPKSTSIDLGFKHPYPMSSSGSLLVNSTDMAPLAINLGVTVAHLFVIKILGEAASIKVKFTSAVGTDQLLNVSGLWVWHSPSTGDGITALSLVGSGEVEFLVAGGST